MRDCPPPAEGRAAPAAGLAGLAAGLDTDALEAAAEAMARRRRILAAGIGKSGLVAAKLAGTLNSLGVAAGTLAPLDAMHGDLGGVGAGDAVLLVSWSGEGGLLAPLAGAVRRQGALAVALAAGGGLAEHADLAVRLPPLPEAGPHGVPVVRTLALMAAADALALAIVRRRGGCTREAFALAHPAGALGRAARFPTTEGD